MVCTGKYGPPAQLIKAILDAGAKAIIASSVELPISHQNPVSDMASTTFEDTVSGQFVIGGDDEDDDLSTPDSDWEDVDWEDGDFESCDQRVKRQEKEEEELASFITTFYDAIYKDGISADLALRKAMESHPKMQYQCHLAFSK